MAVYLGQDEAPSAEIASELARKSDGTPGAALIAEAQITAKVLELDKDTRRIKLELPENNVRETTVREGLDLSKVKVGDTVTIAIANALVIEVVK
jgi:ribosomal protein S1